MVDWLSRRDHVEDGAHRISLLPFVALERLDDIRIRRAMSP
ncbi:hypothetical protein [Candidatus Mycobacterium methanotrophicum]|nr:hypothetical protein [Candidatus Mycobacterium methanotrophicum]